ncbi:MAG: FtsX-like permease family protein, partial [Opitutae bacterium]|nr:FtsX-like permease family protein [Opitutae bacterium]
VVDGEGDYILALKGNQGNLYEAAVAMETAILNILLFLIIAVAGFGILAIFLMIVIEKTRDIGILKSLGASGPGVMGIFLAYGLSLGVVGSGVGTVIYSSCNVDSLARDLAAMPSLRPIRARLFDMFPQTAHREVMALLRRA